MSEVDYEEFKSISTCDLQWKLPCKYCPKLLYRGSVEYKFWAYLFGLYSDSYQKEFKKRVDISKNGFISWSFLFNSSYGSQNLSLGHQYQDALYSQITLIRSLSTNPTGELGFKFEKLETLYRLANAVHLVRENSDVFEFNRAMRKESKESKMNKSKEIEYNEYYNLKMMERLTEIWQLYAQSLRDVVHYYKQHGDKGKNWNKYMR